MTIRTLLEAADKATAGEYQLVDTTRHVRTVLVTHDSQGYESRKYEGVADFGERKDGVFFVAARNSIEDLRKLVEWVRNAPHTSHCQLNYELGVVCDCSKAEILKLLE